MSTNSVPEIVVQIVKAKKEYYTGSKPIMSDFDYDALEAKLKTLDPDHPILYTVGYDSSYDWWLEHYKNLNGVVGWAKASIEMYGFGSDYQDPMHQLAAALRNFPED